MRQHQTLVKEEPPTVCLLFHQVSQKYNVISCLLLPVASRYFYPCTHHSLLSLPLKFETPSSHTYVPHL